MLTIKEKQFLLRYKFENSYKQYLKESGYRWWHFFFPSKNIRKINQWYGDVMYEIENYPEYFDEEGNGVDRIKADYEKGRDLRDYGYKSREQYEA